MCLSSYDVFQFLMICGALGQDVHITDCILDVGHTVSMLLSYACHIRLACGTSFVRRRDSNLESTFEFVSLSLCSLSNEHKLNFNERFVVVNTMSVSRAAKLATAEMGTDSIIH